MWTPNTEREGSSPNNVPQARPIQEFWSLLEMFMTADGKPKISNNWGRAIFRKMRDVQPHIFKEDETNLSQIACQ